MEKEDKVYVMTARQAAKAFPRDKELYARLGAMIDAGYEPEIDDEHPEVTGDDPRFVEVSEFDLFLENFRINLKIRDIFKIPNFFRNSFRQIFTALFSH